MHSTSVDSGVAEDGMECQSLLAHPKALANLTKDYMFIQFNKR
jgi:hypothetical protein